MNRTKAILIFSLLCLFLFSATESQAQKKKKRQSEVDEYFDESGGWAHRLWFGGNVTPAFNSFGGVTNFFLGVAPMMGVKVFENDDRFSIGPRVNFQYSYRKVCSGPNQCEAIQPIAYSFAAFARYKVLPQFFPHVEAEIENRPVYIGTDLVERIVRQNYYVGAGYNSGGLIGYEILLLYNLSIPENSPQSPFDIRIGFTYKF
ncbi:MAG: hypothetical protein AAGG68_19625 [Bacteroidota bacterium]